MLPRLFELPLLASMPIGWPEFAILIAALFGLSALGRRVAATSKLLGTLVGTMPTVAAIVCFVTFLETPFGRIPINSYGFLIMLGFLSGTWVGVKRGERIGLSRDFILDIGIICMIFGIMGGKINYVLQYPSESTGGPASVWNLGDGGLNPLGALLGAIPYLFWWTRTRKEERPPLMHWKNFVLLAATLVLAIVGSRGLYLAGHGSEYDWKIWKDWQSGFVLYGGLIGGILAGMVYVKMRGESIGKVADLLAPMIMLGLAFGRIGCFLNACCYGKVCSLPWGVRYPRTPIGGGPTEVSPVFQHQLDAKLIQDSDTHSLAIHPTQLYEAFVALLLFFILSRFSRTASGKGSVFLSMGMLYAAWRFLLEFLRDDPGRESGGLFGFTYSQTISLFAFIICALWLWVIRDSKTETAPPAEPSQSL